MDFITAIRRILRQKRPSPALAARAAAQGVVDWPQHLFTLLLAGAFLLPVRHARAEAIDSRTFQASAPSSETTLYRTWSARGKPERALPERASAERSYRLPLALAYLLPISLFVAGTALPSPDYYVTGTVGLVGMLGAPPLVHAAYGNAPGAGMAVLGTVGCIVGGFGVGAITLLATDYYPTSCDDGVCRTAYAIGLGGLIGAGVGYLTWGTIDTLFNAHVPQTQWAALRQQEAFTIAPSVAPLVGSHRDGNVTVTGLSMGATGAF